MPGRLPETVGKTTGNSCRTENGSADKKRRCRKGLIVSRFPASFVISSREPDERAVSAAFEKKGCWGKIYLKLLYF